MSNNTTTKNTNNINQASGNTTSSGLTTSVLPTPTPHKASPFDRFNTWWNNKGFSLKLQTIRFKFEALCSSIGRSIRFFLLLGLISLLVVHFCPEAASKYPIMFQFFEGVLKFYEFIFQTTMSGINVVIQIVTLNFGEAGNSFISLFDNFFAGAYSLLSQFVEWVKVVSF